MKEKTKEVIDRNEERWFVAQKAELEMILANHKAEDFEAGYKLYSNTLLTKLDKIAPFRREDKLLDVCSGPISFLEFLPESKLKLAIDSNMESYKRKFPYDLKNSQVIYKTMLAEKMELGDETFDKVFCLNAIDHVLDYKKTLTEIYRVTKKEGIIGLSFENMNYMYKLIYHLNFKKLNDIYHPYTLSYADIVKEIKQSINKNAICYFQSVYEKVTFKNIRTLSKGAGRYHLISSGSLPFFSRLAYYFVLIWNRLFCSLNLCKHAYFVLLIVQKK